MDKLDIKIGNTRYIKRHEFGKITILKEDGTKSTQENFSDLILPVQELIKDAIKLQEEPEKYFDIVKLNDKEIYISKYKGNDIENIVIPEQINGKDVVGISNAFTETPVIKRLYLPDTIKALSYYSFYKMPNLQYIHLAPNINAIPKSCFAYCSSLIGIHLKNIKQIGAFAFKNCKSLELIVSKNIESIGPGAFEECVKLHRIDLPNIKKMQQEAFKYCLALNEANLGNDLEEICYGTFKYCENLNEIKLPKNLSTICSSAFGYCSALKKINFPNNLKTIKENAFLGSGLTDTITFPEGLETISENAFEHTRITAINISDTTEIKNNAFSIDALTNINYINKKNKNTDIQTHER